MTNTEIGAERFFGTRTVEWHLRKVFNNPGVIAGRGLKEAVPARADTRVSPQAEPTRAGRPRVSALAGRETQVSILLAKWPAVGGRPYPQDVVPAPTVFSGSRRRRSLTVVFQLFRSQLLPRGADTNNTAAPFASSHRGGTLARPEICPATIAASSGLTLDSDG